MRILVCGSRHYHEQEQLFAILDKEVEESPYDPVIIITGMAKGADTLAWMWAKSRKMICEEYPADWEKHGRSAGPIRNRQMLKEGNPDLVIAFLAPDSRGTKDMVKAATEAGIQIKIINIK